MPELQGAFSKNWDVSSLGKLGLSGDELQSLRQMSVEDILSQYKNTSRFKRAVVLFELIGHFEREKAVALYTQFDIGHDSHGEKQTAEQLLIIQRTQELFKGDVPARLPRLFSRS